MPKVIGVMSWNTFATVAETKLALDEKKSAPSSSPPLPRPRDALNPTLNAFITLDRERRSPRPVLPMPAAPAVTPRRCSVYPSRTKTST